MSYAKNSDKLNVILFYPYVDKVAIYMYYIDNQLVMSNKAAKRGSKPLF